MTTMMMMIAQTLSWKDSGTKTVLSTARKAASKKWTLQTHNMSDDQDLALKKCVR